MIVLDTTVLVYAVGTQHQFRESCRALIQAIGDGRLTATTTVEAIQEFTHVRARRYGRADATKLASSYLDLLSPLLIVEASDLRKGLELFAEVDALGSFDAVLAAAADSVGATALVSADAAFAAVPGLPHVIPDQAGVQDLLKQG